MMAGAAYAEGPVVSITNGRVDTVRVVRLQEGDCAAGVTALLSPHRTPETNDPLLTAGVQRNAGCAADATVNYILAPEWVGAAPNAAATLDALAVTIPSATDQQLPVRRDIYMSMFRQSVIEQPPATLPPATLASAQRLREAMISRAASGAIERARAAQTRAELNDIVQRFEQQVGAGETIERNGRSVSQGSVLIQGQIAEALAPRLASFSMPPLWLFTETFESRPEQDWRSSPNERRIAQGAPVSQFATTAPTDMEIGLALLRTWQNGLNSGSGAATWEGSSTIAGSVLWYLPADYGGLRNIVHHVRKKSCRRERDGVRCAAEVWIEFRMSRAQESAFSDMPESVWAAMFGPIMYVNNNPIEIEEFFRLTPQGWRAPESEARVRQAQERNSENIAAGLRMSANSDRCMALQLSNNPTANTDPNC